jgi:hypothetical protein
VIAAAALLLSALVGWYMSRYARQDLHCQAVLDTIRVNPFFLTMEIIVLSLERVDKEEASEIIHTITD